MALLKCVECNGDISSQARACPHSGLPQRKRSKLKKVILIICAGTVLVGGPLAYKIYTDAMKSADELMNVTRNAFAATAAKQRERHAVPCTLNDIDVVLLPYKFFSADADSGMKLTGSVRITNNCHKPVGVQLKITGFDENNAFATQTEYWPLHTTNFPRGKTLIDLDSALPYSSRIKTIEAEPIKTRDWTQRYPY